MIKSYQDFFALACIFLGTFAGLLLSIPIAMQNQTSYSGVLLILGAVSGAAIGYRRRNSRMFFYVCLVVILMLSIILVRK